MIRSMGRSMNAQGERCIMSWANPKMDAKKMRVHRAM